MKNIFKILSLIFVFVFSCSNVFANSFDFNEELPKNIIGSLTDENGNIMEVVGHLEDNLSVFNDDLQNSATYSFPLYMNSSNELTTNQTDGSISVRVYLTINYETNTEPIDYHLLTNVSGRWEILDNKVTVEDAVLRYGCTGVSLEHFYVTQVDSKNVNNNFNVSTGFDKYVQKEAGSLNAQIGANLKLDLQMGSTRKWKFEVQNNI